MEVYFVRHGVTQWNGEHRHQGRLVGIGLNEEGRAQVREQATVLPCVPYAVIVCSPLQRAVESAEILRTTGALDAPIVKDDHFNEWSIPRWDRLTFPEIAERLPEAYGTYLGAPDVFSMPGCETLVHVRDRAVEGLRLLAVAYGDTACVLVVTHAAVIAAAVLGILGVNLSLYHRFPVSNASLSVIRTGQEPSLQLFNWHPSKTRQSLAGVRPDDLSD